VSIENVCGIHDLHVWPLSTTATALSVHLVINDVPPEKDFLSKIQQKLHDRFSIEHSTIQLEKSEDNFCVLNTGINSSKS
jgi:cobalt-zinc-cadmium efflux system protein